VIAAKPNSIAGVVQWAQQELSTTVDNALFESSLLLAYTLDVSRAHLLAWPDKTVDGAKLIYFKQLISKRRQGTPIAYITGVKEFWSLPLQVSNDTLIPRPETEKLVEIALNLVENIPSPVVADLGTGSGAIAVAIATERAQSTVIATDITCSTLAIAKSNAIQLKLLHCHFIVSDWCNALAREGFDLVVSNPPYIEENDPHLKQGDIRFEPERALSSGENGMDAINIITQCARACMKSGAWLVIEHGFTQKQHVINKMQQQGYRNIRGFCDDSGHDRVCIAQK